MTKDPTYAELAAAYPELDAFVLLALAKAKEKTNQWTQVVTSSSTTCDTVKDTRGRVINEPPPKTNRRATIEHTKRKMEDEEN